MSPAGAAFSAIFESLKRLNSKSGKLFPKFQMFNAVLIFHSAFSRDLEHPRFSSSLGGSTGEVLAGTATSRSPPRPSLSAGAPRGGATGLC